MFNVFSDGTITYDPSAEELQLASDLGHAWANFVSNGDPNKGLPVPREYPQYVTATDKLVVLEEPDDDSLSQDHVRDKYCDMWDKLGYVF